MKAPRYRTAGRKAPESIGSSHLYRPLRRGSSRKTASIIFLVILILASVSVPFARVQGMVVVTGQMGRDPNGIAYDSGKVETFVANHDDDTVSIISDSADTVIATLLIGGEPVGAAHDPDRSKAFATYYSSDTLSVIYEAAAPFDFNLSITPAEQGVSPGQGFNATVSVGRTSGLPGPVTLSVSGPAGISLPAEVPTSGTPPFTATLTGITPLAPGDYVFVITGRAGDVTHSADLTISVLPPSIVLSSTSGVPGSSVTITGTDFAPLSNISITIGQMRLATIISTAQGTFVASFSVPQASGDYVVTATGSNGVRATQSFRVEPTPFPWIVLAEASVAAVAVAGAVGGFWAVRQSKLPLRPDNPKFTVTVTVTSSVKERRRKSE